jgi:hypothetical protein
MRQDYILNSGRNSGIIGGRLAGLILERYEWNDLSAQPGYEGISKLNVLFPPQS